MNLTDLIALSRRMASRPCDRHPSDTPTVEIDCPGCCSDVKADPDASARSLHSALRAMAACDRRFPKRRRDATCSHPEVWGWCNSAIGNMSDAPSLLITGPVGVGKTYQSYGALRRILANHPALSWEALAFAEFTASLRPGGGVEADHYKTVGLLLLDDLGAGKGSEWVEEVSYRVIDARYEAMLPTIYVTNCGSDELDASLGDRITSRLAGICTQIVMDGPDLRREKR